MPLRVPPGLIAAAVLVAAAACASETPVAPTPSAGAARGGGGGGGSAAALPLAGTWAGMYRSSAGPSDSSQWSLTLRQNGDGLEGGLVRTVYVNGAGYTGVSSIKKGSVSGRSVLLFFARGEGAETETTFSATVGDDGRTMTGFHSRYPDAVTLTRR